MKDPFDITNTTQPDSEIGATDNRGNKRQHTSDTSDSDKDIGAHMEENHLVLIKTLSMQGASRKVEKKKGRKS